MEFSFDRSKNVNTNQQNQNSTQPQNEQQSASSTRDEVDTSQIANERLRKAIERNRARQKEREAQSPQASQSFNRPEANDSNGNHSSAWSQHQAHTGAANPREEMTSHHQSSLFEKQKEANREVPPEVPRETVTAQRPEVSREIPREMPRENRDAARESVRESGSESRRETPREMPRPINRAAMRSASAGATQYTNTNAAENTTKVEEVSEQVASRRTVARPHDTEFAPVRRTSKRAATQISYTTGQKKKVKELDQKYVDYLVKGSWIFCGFLVLRLVFASGGVLSYFSQRGALNERFSELSKIKNENMSLVHEIERMQFDTSYQKRIVRDNLGFIAQDEFLILFPKD